MAGDARGTDAVLDDLRKMGVIDWTIHDDAVRPVATGSQTLDALTGGGLRPGLHCVTGGPASYKSAFCLQLAYLTAQAGRGATYLTGEIGRPECMHRLMSLHMQARAMRGLDAHDAPAWATMGDVVVGLAEAEDADGLERIVRAARAVDALPLDVRELGPRATSDSDRGLESGEYNLRYLPTFVRHAQELEADGDAGEWGDLHEKLGYCDLLVIDPVNELETFTTEWSNARGRWEYSDSHATEQDRLIEAATMLDEFGKRAGVAVVGVFHGNMGGASDERHPGLADYKGTVQIAYRALTLMKLVAWRNMRWADRPPAPHGITDAMGEAVGLFVLKSRRGRTTGRNAPIPFVADGAHNLLWECDRRAE